MSRVERVSDDLRSLKHRLHRQVSPWRWGLHHKLIWAPQNWAFAHFVRSPLSSESFPSGTPWHDMRPTPYKWADGSARITPRRVFCLWTGDNPMTDIRLRNVEAIRSTIGSGIDVVLVTRETLQTWIDPRHPLHPAYEDLSFVHRSDYLRAYLLYHYGGGYVDIKPPLHPWDEAFDRLDSTEGAHCSGFPEIGVQAVGGADPRVARLLRRHYHQSLATQALIFKPHSELAAAWLGGVERVLDARRTQLSECPGDARGRNEGYPLGWTDILERVLRPLLAVYHPYVVQDERLTVDLFSPYQ